MLRVVAIADTHGLHDEMEIPDGDVLVHAGDVSGRGRREEIERFDAFLGTLPHPVKIVIAGNHDFLFEHKPAEARALITNATYLQDSAVTIEGVKFYGSPWQPWFYDWAFNLHRGEAIRKVWDLIPEDTDVLITHGPPAFHGDRCTDGRKVGCMDLHEVIEVVRPKFHVFGHIHEGYGTTRDEHTTYINASSCDFGYAPVNPPVVFEVERG